jgi:dephospho-CoA kinase
MSNSIALFLAKQVFGSKEQLAVLNGLVHPAVARDFMAWVSQHTDHSYIMKEAAILFEKWRLQGGGRNHFGYC